MLVSGDELAKILEMVGNPFAVDAEEYFGNSEATVDNLRHFALAAGDTNPLWHDEAYAKQSRGGELLAMPTFLCSVLHTGYFHQKICPEGLHGLLGEHSWEFFRPVRVGDRFVVTGQIMRVQEVESRSLGPALMVTSTLRFFTFADDLLASLTSRTWIYDVRNRSGGSRSGDTSSRSVSEERGPAPREEPSGRQFRGSDPLLWGDVEVGDLVTPQLRPALSQTEMMEWLIGTHTIGTVSRRTKADGHLRFTFSNAHIDAESARKLGFPAPFDIGNQRVAWLASLLTGWMGDHGELKALRCKFQRLIFVGDIPTCGGTIVKKRVDERDHLVDLELWVKNQRYEEVSVGTATVALPLR